MPSPHRTNRLASQLLRILAWTFCIAVHCFNNQASADPASCTLLVADLKQEAVQDWKNLGYQVVENKGLASVVPSTLAPLLDDTHFALNRNFGKSEFQLSLTGGQYSQGWQPLAFAAPKNGEKPNPNSYSCRDMQTRLAYFKEVRIGISDAERLVGDEKIGRTHGEVILDLERSFFIESHLSAMANTEAKKIYLDLLEKVKQIKATGSGDFFQQWLKVRNEVYGSDKLNVDYCRDIQSMTEALVKKCTNCVGETYLILALFQDSGILPPEGWHLAGQEFSDHLRPVLFNRTNQTTYDLVTGKIGAYKASIFDSETLYRMLIVGGNTMRIPGEIDQLKQIQTQYEFKGFGCNLPQFIVRPSTQPSLTELAAACDRYSPEDPPEKADNESKSKNVSSNEDTENKSKDGNGDGDFVSKLLSGAGALATLPFIAAADLLTGKGSFWFGNPFSTGHEMTDEEKLQIEKDTKYLASTLNTEESQILLQSLNDHRFNQQMIDHFSIHALLRDFDLGYLEQSGELSPTDWGWDTITWPVLIEKFPEGSKENFEVVSDISKISITSCLSIGTVCVRTADDAFLAELKPLSNSQRMLKITEYIEKIQQKTIDQFLVPTPETPRDAFLQIRNLTLKKTEQLIDSIEIGETWSEPQSIKSHKPNGEETYGRTPAMPAAIKILLHGEKFKSVGALALKQSQIIMEHPVEMIRFAEMNGTDRALFFLGTKLITKILVNLKAFADNFPNTLNAADYSLWNSDTIGGILLLKLLTHQKYFFTVEAEKEEIPPLRPYYPLRILEPSVQDLEIKNTDLELPHVNLPVWPGTEKCKSGMTGFQQIKGTAFYLDCTSKQSETSQPKSGSDLVDNSGIPDGSKQGVSLTGNKSGPDEISQDGQTHLVTQGQDQQGTLVLNSPLSPDEKMYPASIQAETIRPGNMTDSYKNLAAFDPRQEVDLEGQTWDSLLESAIPLTNVYLSNDILMDPIVKILLHHTFRRKLNKIYFKYQNHDPFMTLLPHDIDPKIFAGDEEAWKYLKQKCMSFGMESPRCDIQDEAFDKFLSSQQKVNSLYSGFDEEPYMKAAISELEKLKPGYIQLSNDQILPEPQAAVDILAGKLESIPGWNLPGGIQTPLMVETADGTTQFPQVPMYIYSKKLRKESEPYYKDIRYSDSEIPIIENTPMNPRNTGNVKGETLIEDLETRLLPIAITAEHGARFLGPSKIFIYKVGKQKGPISREDLLIILKSLSINERYLGPGEG